MYMSNLHFMNSERDGNRIGTKVGQSGGGGGGAERVMGRV